MGRLRILLVASLLVAFGLVLGSGCRDATQVTLDISLAKHALCTETNGTAITVGVDPASTEDRVAHEYVTATTSSCDPATREIGTLVLTPSGSGRASVIVVVAYDKVAPASCKPPLFKGCIVARRQFSFTDHRHLQMPISIDPDCRDVPCDAFSTCRSGKCFSSETACNGDTCTEPGDPGDGGTAVDGQVIPDTGMPVDGSPDDGSLDGPGTDGPPGLDGSLNDGGGGTDGTVPEAGGVFPPGVWCNMSGELVCPDPFTCIDATSCCGPTNGSTAMCRGGTGTCVAGTEQQYCCPNTVCPGLTKCFIGMVVGADAALPMPGFVASAQMPAGTTQAGVCQ